MLRLQPMEHEAVHGGVVKLGIRRGEQLVEAERRPRIFLQLGRGVRGVVVRGAVRVGGPLVVVGKIAQCRRLVSVADLIVEKRACLAARLPSLRVAAFVLAPGIFKCSVSSRSLPLQPPLTLICPFQLFGRLLSALAEEIPHKRLVAIPLRKITSHKLVVILVVHCAHVT